MFYQESRIFTKLTVIWHSAVIDKLQLYDENKQSPEVDPSIFEHLIYDKGDAAEQWEKESIFHKCMRSLDINVRGKEEKLDPCLTPCTNSNSRGKSKRTNLMFLVGRLDIVKMLVFLNVTFRFKAIPIKIPVSYLEDIDKLIRKFIWRCKRYICTIMNFTTK